MGRTLQEAKLADNVGITIRRYRADPVPPATVGDLKYTLVVEASTADGTTGEFIRSYSRDVWDRLTPTQQTNLTNLAQAIIDKMAAALEVAAS